MTDVFVCYSRRDLDFVRRLAESLRERGRDMFVDLGQWWHDDGDPRHGVSADREQATRSSDATGTHSEVSADVGMIDDTEPDATGTSRAGERADDVHTAITGATAVLVVVSPALAASARCRNEIERSVALRKRIVVVRAQETPVESLP